MAACAELGGPLGEGEDGGALRPRGVLWEP